MKKVFVFFLYLIGFIEGFLLMANELMSSKLLANSFGNSIQSWSVLLSVTLFFLAIGYYFGGKISSKIELMNGIIGLFIFVFVFQYFNPGDYFFTYLINLKNLSGTILYSILMIGPIVMGLGAITPLIVSVLIEKFSQPVGNVSGMVYGISTFGGVLATFLFGLYYLPILGISYSKNFLLLLTLVAMMVVLALKKLM